MPFNLKEGDSGIGLGMKEAGIFPYEMFPQGMLKLYIDATHVR